MRFLRNELDVQNAEIALRIHCHTHDTGVIELIEKYWLDLLCLPQSCLRKDVIQGRAVRSRKKRLTNGVCGIRVHRTDLVQHIYGAIQEYGGFDRPEWLF